MSLLSPKARLEATGQDIVESLYVDHNSWLRNWLRHKTGCSELAVDLAQDTFLRLLNYRNLSVPEVPRAFLTIIAKQVMISHFRRKKLEMAWLELQAERPAEYDISLEERAILIETLLEIDRRLDRLPLPVRQAFLLFQLDGLTQAEIAVKLDLSVATVKRHIVRAAEKLYFPD